MKFLIPFLAIASSLSAEGEDGWYSVEKTTTVEPEETWEEGVVWPVFIKKHLSENFLIRFPAPPNYTYTESEVLHIQAQQGGEIYTLIVTPEKDLFEKRLQELASSENVIVISYEMPASGVLDLQYYQNNHWISERLQLSEKALYLLQTSNPDSLSFHHETFIRFLDVQK